MTDPYEYLLNKLNIILEFMPKFMPSYYSMYLKLETGKKLVTNYIPANWTSEKIFKFCRNIDSNPWFRQCHKELGVFCQLLQQFPNDLESIEHVDLLLAVNGLNKEA